MYRIHFPATLVASVWRSSESWNLQRFVWQTSENAFDTFPIHTQLPTLHVAKFVGTGRQFASLHFTWQLLRQLLLLDFFIIFLFLHPL